jgi:hypothetical protein
VRLIVDLYNHNWDLWWSCCGEPLQQFADHRSFLPTNLWSDVGAFAFGHTTGGPCVDQATASLLDNVSAFESPDCIRFPGGCPCSADFNGDGDIGTDADIESFFACLGGSCCAACQSADFNRDGDVGTDADIESFFRVLGGGSC